MGDDQKSNTQTSNGDSASVKTLRITVSCKNCGGTVILEKQNVPSKGSSACGVTTRGCSKCHKTSSYAIRIRDGEIIDIR